MEKRIGQPPILYTYSSFWQSAVGNAAGFERYPLWLANYGKDDGKVHPVRTVGSWPSIADPPVHLEGPHCRLGRSRRPEPAEEGLDARQAHGSAPSRRRGPGTGRRGGSGEEEVVHEARRLDAAFLALVAEQAKAGGTVTIRGTLRDKP